MENDFLLQRRRIILDLILCSSGLGVLIWQLIKWCPTLLSKKNINEVIDSGVWHQVFCYLFLLIISISFIFVVYALLKKIFSLLFFINTYITVSDNAITFFHKGDSYVKLDKQFLKIHFLPHGVNLLFEDCKIKKKYWLPKSFFINTTEYDRFTDLMRNLNK